MTPGDWASVAPEFTPADFRFPERMGLEFVRWLRAVRRAAGIPMHCSSDYRSPAHNESVGGAADSAHCDALCDAADFAGPATPDPDDPHWNLGRWKLIRAAMNLGCVRVGVYANGSVHFDRTEDRRPAPRFWHQVDNPA